MGATSADTLKEIDEARVKLERDLTELGDRIPRPEPWMKRVAIAAFAGSIILFVVSKFRGRTN